MWTKSTWFLVLMTALLLSGCGGKEKRIAEHLSRARDYVAQGILDKAQVELKNVLQIDPKAAEPYFLFGRIEERQKNLQKAFGYYLKAVELAPSNNVARGKLGMFYLLAGDLVNAKKQADAILASKADDPDGLVLKASILAQEGDVAGAITQAEAILAANPKQVDGRSLLAAMIMMRGDRPRAIEVLSQGVVAVPDSADLRLALVSLLVVEKRLDEAAKQYEALITQDPKSVEHRVGLARLQAEQGGLDAAEATLRAAIAADPEDDQRYVFLADFLATRRDIATAETMLTQSIAKRPQAHALRFALTQLYRSRGMPDRAEGVYREVLKLDATGPSGVRARAELADYLVSKGKTGEAAALVAEVLKSNPRDSRALTLRGKMALARGDAVNAIADLRAVLKDQPDSIDILMDLARAHLANDEVALAKDTLAQALGRYPRSVPLRIMLAEIKTATGDHSGAAADLKAVLDQSPKDLRALAARANLESRRGEMRAAEVTLNEIKNINPKDPTAFHRLGAFHLARKQYKEAEEAFEAALTLMPGAIEPLTGLVNVSIARGQPQAGVARLEKDLVQTPDNFLMWALLGHAYSASKNLARAENAFRKAVEKNPAMAGSHMELAKFLASHGHKPEALRAIQEGLKALPDNPALAAQLAELHREARRVDEAMQVYERMLIVDPTSDLAANNLASLLLDQRTDRASFERALQLAQRFETSLNPAYLDSLGWAHYRLGTYDKAVEVLRRAKARAADSVLLSFHYGMALHDKGEKAGAKEYLRKAVESKAAIPGIEVAKRILAVGDS